MPEVDHNSTPAACLDAVTTIMLGVSDDSIAAVKGDPPTLAKHKTALRKIKKEVQDAADKLPERMRLVDDMRAQCVVLDAEIETAEAAVLAANKALAAARVPLTRAQTARRECDTAIYKLNREAYGTVRPYVLYSDARKTIALLEKNNAKRSRVAEE